MVAMAAVQVEVSDLSSEQTMHAILETLLRLEARMPPPDSALLLVAQAIDQNTAILSTLSTNPPQTQKGTP